MPFSLCGCWILKPRPGQPPVIRGCQCLQTRLSSRPHHQRLHPFQNEGQKDEAVAPDNAKSMAEHPNGHADTFQTAPSFLRLRDAWTDVRAAVADTGTAQAIDLDCGKALARFPWWNSDIRERLSMAPGNGRVHALGGEGGAARGAASATRTRWRHRERGWQPGVVRRTESNTPLPFSQ